VRITATTSSVHVSSNESHTSTALYPAWAHGIPRGVFGAPSIRS
jgi:hypothetical protein